MEDLRDAKEKSTQERFAEIRQFFLAKLEESGQSRTELYYRPKPGDAREPTEEEIVRRWAARTALSIEWICAGIHNAFVTAGERGAIVTSFRYCVPHIAAIADQLARERKAPL